MNMSEAVRSVLTQYATFSGRAGRPEFWWWVLASLLASIVVNLIDYAIGMGEVMPLSLIFGLADPAAQISRCRSGACTTSTGRDGGC